MSDAQGAITHTFPDRGAGEWVALEDYAALQAENERLRAALRECEADIDGYIRQEYPLDHPTHDRYRQRDFSANPARIGLNPTP